jgi:hypothetical protein
MTSVPDDTNVYPNANDCLANTCVDGGTVTTSKATGSACLLSSGTGVCEFDVMNSFTCVQCGGAATAMCLGLTPSCYQNTCVVSTCGDGTTDGSETDRDCGGASCVRCSGGKMCMTGTDCQSNSCLGNVCIDVSCSDGAQDGTETDVDCGGSCSKACANGKKCALATDCQSRVCMPTDGGPHVCQAPTCTDGVMNGTETGVDCNLDGGPCPPCAM